MAENSKIEWTDHTFNPWRGCTHVSPGCEHCYAETLAKRNPDVLGTWGAHGRRVVASESYWRQPERWNRAAEAEGVHKRVFCASLADVFETLPDNHPDADAVWNARERLWALIEATPALDWLLLTKRPESILVMVPPAWRYQFPINIWMGTSVEDQKAADQRISKLLQVPATVRFLSCEPLLGSINLRCYGAYQGKGWQYGCDCLNQEYASVQWVIAGGESGPGARPAHLDWFRFLRDQCQATGVPFFFKQHGEWYPLATADEASQYPNAKLHEWEDGMRSIRIGKNTAGRILDGRTWNEFPQIGVSQ